MSYTQCQTQTQIYDAEFQPDNYPPLPNGLVAAELDTISLAKLRTGCHDEEDRLFQICKCRGFFYLDLNKSSAQHMRSTSEDIARIAEEFFRLPTDAKSEYLPHKVSNNTLFGYKYAGRLATDEKQTPDTAEFMNVPKNEMILPQPKAQWPGMISNNQDLLRGYMTTAHETGLFLLSILAKKMNLPPNAFANLHRIHEQSGDHIRLTRGPPRKTADLPEIQTPGHTDFGTITLLFNWLGGLQIWSEPNRGRSGFSNVVDPEGSTGQWLWVKPKRGQIIVNLGDAAVKFTNGLLCSGRHRVVPAPGEQGKWPRYSVVYFVRPEDKVILKAFESPGVIEPPTVAEEEISAIEWIKGQVRAMQAKQ